MEESKNGMEEVIEKDTDLLEDFSDSKKRVRDCLREWIPPHKQILIVFLLIMVSFVVSLAILIPKIVRQCVDDAFYSDIRKIADSTCEPENGNLSFSDIEGLHGEGMAYPNNTDQNHSLITPSPMPGGILTYEDAEVSPTPESEYDKLKDYSYAKKNFKKLKEINSDCIGWIQIEGTSINYPVVYASDASKYLDIGFDGRANRNGTLFVTGKNGASGQNVTIYGHAMAAANSMFSPLKEYKNKKFWSKHDTILYSTPSGEKEYKVFAAFSVSIEGKTFGYTQKDFLNDIDFQNFIKEAMSRSYHNMGDKVPDGARILTLSTCETNKTRIVVMGYSN